MYKKDFDWKAIDGKIISRAKASEPGEVGLRSSPWSVLYQAGYLTLRYRPETHDYMLTYPNFEVRAAMETLMVNNYYDSLDAAETDQSSLRNSFVENEYSMIVALFNRLISNIVYKNKQLLKNAASNVKESFYRANIISFLLGAEFFTQGEVDSNLGSADIVADFNKRKLVIEVKYVDARPDNGKSGKPSASKIRTRCREKLREAVQQLYNKNYAGSFANPMILAIVLDESYKGGCISHAAYGNVAYHIHGDPATHTPIGDICEKDNVWSVAWRK